MVEQLGEDAVVERRADGAVVVTLPVVNRAAFRTWVLGLLDHAEVLAPPELRADMVAWLDAARSTGTTTKREPAPARSGRACSACSRWCRTSSRTPA